MAGQTNGIVKIILRTEGVCVLFASIFAYSKLGFDWSTFALYFLIPDISFLGYLAGSRVGAICYNSAHSYIGAIICLFSGYAFPNNTLICAGIIWCAHIGFDRSLGYGLKYSSGFSFTHLGIIGRVAKNPSTTTNEAASQPN